MGSGGFGTEDDGGPFTSVEEQYRLLMQNLTDHAIFFLDVEGRVSTWSVAAERLLGYREDEVLGQPVDRFFTLEDRHQGVPAQELLTAAVHGRAGDDRWHVRRDGTRFWASGSLTALRDEQGELRGFAKVFRDRTPQKGLEDRLHEETAAAEMLNRIGSILAAELDLQRLVQVVTDEATRLTGAQFGAFFYNVVNGRGESYSLYTLSGVAREAFARFPMPRNTAVFAPTFQGQGVVRLDDVTQDPRYGKNAPYRGMPEGHLAVRSYLAVPVVSRSGDVLGGLFFGHPEAGRFTAQHERVLVGVAAQAAIAIDNARLYQQAREQAEALREADRRKDEWLAMLAHELRGPLSPITTGVEVLRLKGPPSPELLQTGEMITRQVRHLAHLVNDLLDVTRITRGLIRLSKERLDLARLVQTAAADFRPTLEQGGLTLNVTVPETPAWVQGDASRLTQVLHNLLDNARKFTEPGGRVEARLEVDSRQQRATLHVRDSGAGIEPEMLARLFEPLSQADRSLHRTKGGLGLGLALVKGLTELHGGTAEARSEGPGRGAEFIVRLPLEPEPAALAAIPEASQPAEQRHRVLIIEDNRDAADSLQMLLELLGHEVQVAYTGPDGVKLATQWGPEVIVSDIGLPGLDGYGVARELRRNPVTARVRLIAVTGYGREDDHRLARESGFDHVITKPAEPGVLLEALAGRT